MQDISKPELIKFFGLRVAMAVEPRKGGLPEYWKTEAAYKPMKTVRTAANYLERFGMSRHRFQLISSCLRLALPENPDLPDEEKVRITLFFI